MNILHKAFCTYVHLQVHIANMTHEIKLQLLSNYRNITVRNKTTASKLCVVLSSTAGNIMHNDDKLIVMRYSVEKLFHFTNSELFGDI